MAIAMESATSFQSYWPGRMVGVIELLRNTRKTVAVSIAPPKGLASSILLGGAQAYPLRYRRGATRPSTYPFGKHGV